MTYDAVTFEVMESGVHFTVTAAWTGGYCDTFVDKWELTDTPIEGVTIERPPVRGSRAGCGYAKPLRTTLAALAAGFKAAGLAYADNMAVTVLRRSLERDEAAWEYSLSYTARVRGKVAVTNEECRHWFNWSVMDDAPLLAVARAEFLDACSVDAAENVLYPCGY